MAQLADRKSEIASNQLKAALAEFLAQRWGTSVRTGWRRAKAFREDSGLRSVLRRQRGPIAGVPKLNSTLDSIISDTARSWWKANAQISRRVNSPQPAISLALQTHR